MTTFDFRNVQPSKPEKFPPTDEQHQVIDAYLAGHNLVVEAGAGSGKTKTLEFVGQASTSSRGIYIARGKAIADEAKQRFPSNVACSTAHSLAYRAVGKFYSSRLGSPRLPSYLLVQRLRVPGALDFEGVSLKPVQLARFTMETIDRFCRSDADTIGAQHVPFVPGMKLEDREVFQEFILPLALKAWDDISDPHGSLPFSHDNYLKIWQLGDPELNADFLMLDEAQDANPVIASIVERQECQKILVGDRCQSIFGWTGAIDAMQNFEGTRLYLTQSFRFGNAVAAEANKFLTFLDTPLRIRGYDKIASVVREEATPRAILTRTNASAVVEAMMQLQASRRVAIVGGGEAMCSLARAAITLQRGESTDHPELCMFRDWGELVEYTQNDSAGADLAVLVKIVSEHGAQAIISTVDALSDEAQADVVISTAHKAKGREWPSVRISGDFDRSRSKKSEELPDRSELMLAYVAVTRAKEVLDRTGLNWVDRFLEAL